MISRTYSAFHPIAQQELVTNGIVFGSVEDGYNDEPASIALAPNGKIVAVMIDGEATVKRIYFEGSRVRLQPANSAMEPIYIERAQFGRSQIVGWVTGVFRTL